MQRRQWCRAGFGFLSRLCFSIQVKCGNHGDLFEIASGIALWRSRPEPCRASDAEGGHEVAAGNCGPGRVRGRQVVDVAGRDAQQNQIGRAFHVHDDRRCATRCILVCGDNLLLSNGPPGLTAPRKDRARDAGQCVYELAPLRGPRLSLRGLAKLCGVSHNTIGDAMAAWRSGDRTGRLARLLKDAGLGGKQLHIDTESGEHAYPETVVVQVLQYYAMHAQNPTEQARVAVNLLLKAGFRMFVYNAVGYVPPSVKVPKEWRQFHDRLRLNNAPDGYFSVFMETSGFVLSAIRQGLEVDSHTVPDVSVGQIWTKHWESNNLDARFGDRCKHPHEYPDYFPQAKASGLEAWVYPNAALPTFRNWVQKTYIPEKFPKYLKNKVKIGDLPPSVAEAILLGAKPVEIKKRS